MFEIILYIGLASISSFSIGLFIGNILKNNGEIIIKKINDDLYKIYYDIDNVKYNLLINTKKAKKSTIYQKVKDENGNDITNNIISYVKGINSVVAKEEIILKQLGHKKIYIECEDINYIITEKSSVFGLVDYLIEN